MNRHIIGYDLRGKRDYHSLYQAIRSYGFYVHTLESQWIIVTNRSVVEVRDYLLKYIDDNDGLFVATLTGNTAWNKLLTGDVGVKWLDDHLPSKSNS